MAPYVSLTLIPWSMASLDTWPFTIQGEKGKTATAWPLLLRGAYRLSERRPPLAAAPGKKKVGRPKGPKNSEMTAAPATLLGPRGGDARDCDVRDRRCG